MIFFSMVKKIELLELRETIPKGISLCFPAAKLL